MGSFIDLTGQKFGRFTVLGRAENRGPRNDVVAWNCLCECGVKRIVRSCGLRSGGTRSCGCFQRDQVMESATKHGMAKNGQKSSTYGSWCCARQRCTNPKVAQWKDYGGRGITMCERWSTSFTAFLDDMGERPANATLERINNDGNYEPSNCRWATKREQVLNRRNAIFVSFAGARIRLIDLAADLKLSYGALRLRIRAGQDASEAILRMI